MAISREMKELKKILDQVPEDRQPIAKSLYKEIVFMENTLDTLKEQVEKDGPVSLFKQGKQEFLRESPALQGYNKTLQRYNQTIKQVVDLLPPAEVETKDELMDFIKGD